MNPTHQQPHHHQKRAISTTTLSNHDSPPTSQPNNFNIKGPGLYQVPTPIPTTKPRRTGHRMQNARQPARLLLGITAAETTGIDSQGPRWGSRHHLPAVSCLAVWPVNPRPAGGERKVGGQKVLGPPPAPISHWHAYQKPSSSLSSSPSTHDNIPPPLSFPRTRFLRSRAWNRSRGNLLLSASAPRKMSHGTCH